MHISAACLGGLKIACLLAYLLTYLLTIHRDVDRHSLLLAPVRLVLGACPIEVEQVWDLGVA